MKAKDFIYMIFNEADYVTPSAYINARELKTYPEGYPVWLQKVPNSQNTKNTNIPGKELHMWVTIVDDDPEEDYISTIGQLKQYFRDNGVTPDTEIIFDTDSGDDSGMRIKSHRGAGQIEVSLIFPKG